MEPISNQNVRLSNSSSAPLLRSSASNDAGPLIHKSPDVSYRSDGSVITRLCLKVDADNFRDSEFGILDDTRQ